MVPDASVTSLVCEHYCNQDDEFWSRSEPDIVDLAARELETMGFLHTSEVSEGFINADHALETGIMAARNILGSRYDLASVNSPSSLARTIRELA